MSPVASTPNRGLQKQRRKVKAGVGRTPRHDSSRQKTSSSYPRVQRLKRSTRIGVFLYLARQGHMSTEQRAFLAHLQGKANFDELARAIKVYKDLCSSERLRARLQIEKRHIPAEPSPPRPKEQRRIGIGYRDKGSLRPPHRPTKPGEITVSSDQEALLQQQLKWVPQELLEGQRMTSDEVGLSYARSLRAQHQSALLRHGSYVEGGTPIVSNQPPKPYWEKSPTQQAQEDKERLFELLAREGISRASWELLKEILPGKQSTEPSKPPEPPEKAGKSLLPKLLENWKQNGGTRL